MLSFAFADAKGATRKFHQPFRSRVHCALPSQQRLNSKGFRLAISVAGPDSPPGVRGGTGPSWGFSGPFWGGFRGERSVDGACGEGARVRRGSCRDLGGPKHQAFAKFIRQGDDNGPIPCWGAILERLEQDFPGDNDRDNLLGVAIAEGDNRPLYLLLHSARSRPAVLRKMLRRAAEMPVQVQRYLVSLPEAAPHVPDAVDVLDPAARQVWEAGEAMRRIELQVFEAKVGELRQFEWFSTSQFPLPE